MAQTIADPRILESLVRRLAMLRPDTARRWGTLSAGEMLCHLGDAHESVLGVRIPQGPTPLRTRRPFMKWLVLYSLVPWPKGAKTREGVNPRIAGTRPGDFEQDRDRAVRSLMAIAVAAPSSLSPAHFMLGEMSAEDWRRWAFRHVGHHLRQFNL